ncbi:hypothetical protein JXA88_18055 [Candidatus Fermentibacteria bacterium]|nr:hypothetical protein [Candidatus Fermentibacteria bacterium]
MRRTAILLLLLAAPCLWAVGVAPVPTAGELTRQTEYTCNDGSSEGYFWLTDVGEGFANHFTPAVYPSRIDAVTIGLMNYIDNNYHVQYPTCMVYVWADAGGQPGTVLFSGTVTLEAPGTSGTFGWNTVDIAGQNIVIDSGSFWVGFLDDGSLTVESPYDDPDACGTYYYYPAAGSWMPLSDLGYPYGVYLGALVGEGVPVELSSFDASATDGGVRLTWRTLSETDCFGFYLLRAADEQTMGVRIGEGLLPGHGTTAATNDYTFLDETISSGVWFYRLVQVDTDGSETSYGPLRVTWGAAGSSWGRIKSEFK